MAELRPLLSIHDVMPETLRRIMEILDFLTEHGLPPATLLVVPGKDWAPDQLMQLKQWADSGHELAAHGWHHRVDRITRPYHRLHSLLLSRNVAEHLALDSAAILELMQASATWFDRKGLPRPDLYVPPAWALGPLKPAHRRQLPYDRIEVLRGYLDTATGHLQRIPMVGFEADTPWRTFCLRRWNGSQIRSARRRSGYIRVGLHPDDLYLGLAEDLKNFCRSLAPDSAKLPFRPVDRRQL